METRARIFTPGPVELHERVLTALSKQVLSHRSAEFRKVLAEILEGVRRAALSEHAVPLLLTGSGTLAVDSMVYSIVDPGDEVILLEFGEFGSRLRKTLETRGCHVTVLRARPGRAVEVEEVEEVLDTRSNYRALFTVHNETSTGAKLSDLREIAEEAKKRGLLVCIDAVSSLGGEPLYMDAWGIDAVATCSQKCLGGPPGLSFVLLSREAVRRARETKAKPPYLDLSKYIEFAEKFETPFTPAVNLLFAMREALTLLAEEGLQRRWARYANLASRLYTELGELGLEAFPERDFRANTIVALRPPPGLSASIVVDKLEEEGVIIARGMGELRDSMLRIGVMGYMTDEDVDTIVSAFGRVMEGLSK
ncbi:MAG: alanine--glyoxylate aminotransferase family protein [Fervidicoccaceae archaeon]